jgi:hypothetical protein
VTRLDPTYLAFAIVHCFADNVRDSAVKGVGALAPHCKDLGTELGLQQKKGCTLSRQHVCGPMHSAARNTKAVRITNAT